jgi:hypothetical protein
LCRGGPAGVGRYAGSLTHNLGEPVRNWKLRERSQSGGNLCGQRCEDWRTIVERRAGSELAGELGKICGLIEPVGGEQLGRGVLSVSDSLLSNQA